MFCQEKLFSLWRKYNYWLLPLFSGLLLSFNYPITRFKWLVWISLIPLLIFLNRRQTSIKNAFWAGLSTGLIFFGFNLSWFFDTLPLNWIGIESRFIGFLAVAFVWLVSIEFLALFIGLFCLIFQKIKTSTWFDWLLLPCLWIIFEYSRAWGFGLLWLSPSSLLGAHWTFGLLAYGLAGYSNLRQLAGLGGPYLLSFLAVLVNALIFSLFLKIKKNYPFPTPRKIFSAALLLGLMIILLGSANLAGAVIKNQKILQAKNSPVIEIALIQTNLPSFFQQTIEERKEVFILQANLLKQAGQLKPKPEIIFLPEDSRFFSIFKTEAPKVISQIFGGQKVLIVDSGREQKDNQSQTKIIYYQNPQGLISQSDKLLLVPGGEYLPYCISFLARLLGQNDWVKEFQKNRTYQKGNQVKVIEFEGVKIGGWLCSAIFSPPLYQALAQKNAQILFNLASEAPFHNSKKLAAQVLAVSRLRAIENNRQLVKAANSGYSYFINHLGQAQKITKNTQNQVINNPVLLLTQKTWYNKLGDGIIWLSLIIVLSKELFYQFKKNK